MNGERFSINGIAVTARPLGNGLFIGVPDNLMEALGALLSGKLFEPRTIERLPAADAFPSTSFTPEPEYQKPPFPPAPKWTPPTPQSETITQFRARTGMSRTQTADMLNISRRSLGRWELKGKRMAEV